MPAPLDISIWHSLWAIEKKKGDAALTPKEGLRDFNIGYVTTIFLGVCFVALGALVMFGTGESFSPQGGIFAAQLIRLYTGNLGEASYVFIAVAAFTTMFSTTLTTLDASPRAMAKTMELLRGNGRYSYLFWIIVLVVGTLVIFIFFLSEMGLLVKIATILSFMTAPFYALLNLKVIRSKHTPAEWRPSQGLTILSWMGILFLTGFSVWYVSSLG